MVLYKNFSKAVNKEPTLNGFKITGLAFAVIGSLIVMIKIGVSWFLVGSVPGYIIGDIFSSNWYKGKMQKWLYWHTPLFSFLGGKRLPASWKRWFL